MIKQVILVALISLGLGLSQAKPQISFDAVSSSNKDFRIEESAFFLDDSTNRMGIGEVIGCNHFRKLNSSAPNFGLTSSTIWIRLNLNVENEDCWNLVISNPNLAEVTFYSSALKYKPIANSKNNKKHINYVFPLPRGQQTIYVRIRNDEIFFVPMEISSTDNLLHFRHKMNIAQGIFYGLIFFFLVYNTIVFLSLKDNSYLYYVPYTIFLSLVASYMTGYFGHLSPSNLYWFNNYTLFSAIAAIFGLKFLDSFLPIRRRIAKLYWTRIVMIGFLVLAMLLQVFNFHSSAVVLTEVCVSILAVYFIVRGCLAIFSNNFKLGYLLVLAWIFLPLTLLIYMLASMGVIPYNEYLIYVPQTAIVAEAVIISIVLAGRVSSFILEREKSQKREHDTLVRYNNLVADHNANLQKRVLERTAELEKTNAVKDKFFSIVAHDLRNPLHSLAGFLNLFNNSMNNAFSDQELFSIVGKLKESVRNTIDLTEYLLAWAKSQMESEHVLIKPIELGALICQTIQPLKDSARSKGIELVTCVPQTLKVSADENHLRFIIRNLISNAIKFTIPGGKIIVSAEGTVHGVIVKVEDNGVGMTPEVMSILFKVDVKKNMQGTRGEKGTGLGLVLCKEFLELNNGKIEISSQLNHGSVFKLTLMAA